MEWLVTVYGKHDEVRGHFTVVADCKSEAFKVASKELEDDWGWDSLTVKPI